MLSGQKRYCQRNRIGIEMRKKLDVKLKSVADMFTHLLEGRVLVSEVTNAEMEIRDNVFYLKGRPTDSSNFLRLSDDIADFYEVYEEVEWYEDIPEGGILCWVSNWEKQYPDIVTEYADGYFHTPNGDTWRTATPFTQEDIVGKIL